MKKILCAIVLLFLTGSMFAQVLPQYTLNGSATQNSCNMYTLTPDQGTKTGSVWNNYKINLNQSFDFNFDVFLGTHDSPGADGIAFVLQPISTSVGSTGSGLGYQGVSPAVGITIDTYQNITDSDPIFDHIAIQLNGDLNHGSANNIAGPVTAINGNDNIEDGQWHSFHIIWDAGTKSLSAYIDGSLRVSAVKDLVTDVFGGNPMVFWGFTGSTGGESNLQQFKTALNPAISFGIAQAKCVNLPITFYDSTISFTTVASLTWNFGDGSPLNSVDQNPVHTYTAPGYYTITQQVVGADGCQATNTQTILIGSKPIADFRINDNCATNTINFTDTSTTLYGTINNWFWNFDNLSTSSVQNPSTSFATGGDKMIQLAVKSVEGCQSDTLSQLIHIFSKPIVDFTFTDSVCIGSATQFFGKIISASDPITNFAWDIEGNHFITQNANYTFATAGLHTAIFLATSNGSNGCLGLSEKNVFVVNKPTANFSVNTICQSTATLFTDLSSATNALPITNWWWNLGNAGTSFAQNPTATYALAGPDTIQLVVQSSKGCVSDTLKKVIVINALPIANFNYSTPLCNALPVQFTDSSAGQGDIVNKWSWVYNNAEWSTAQNTTNSFSAGLQTVKLVATSAAGCVSDTVAKTFLVNASPDVSINFKDACKNSVVNFTAIDNSATVTQWQWIFGDGIFANTQNAQHSYAANGIYNVQLIATATNGCYSNSLKGNINIYGTQAFAGVDTFAAAGQPVQLHASGGLSYSWSPSYLLDSPNIATPIAILNTTQTFTVKAFTPEGCESYDDVKVEIYKGPDIYLPNAFTPNNDGLNDLLRGKPVGLKQFNYLKIYNRWGQQIFYTTDYNKGWDGFFKGQKQEYGTYVVIANGIDFNGKIINKKQTVILMR